VYASLFPAGGGLAELALASADRLAPMPDQASFQEAAGLVIGAGTAHDGLVDRGLLHAGETVLITAAVGGVGSAAVQIAAMGARPIGVASPPNHEYLRGLGASEVFDYDAADWIEQVLAVVPGGVDLLLDCVGGQTMDQAVGAVRDGGRAISVIPPFGPFHQRSHPATVTRSAKSVGGRAPLRSLMRSVRVFRRKRRQMAATNHSRPMRATVTRSEARQIIDTAVAEAESMSTPVTVAVVDESGILKHLERMDGAALVSVQTAMSKAYAAAAIEMPTDEFFAAIESDAAAVASFATRPGLALIAGGLPLLVEGQIAGAIGVAGAMTGEADRRIAEAALRDTGR
jgi:uncharacterized protein GlcG (DUF336 family)